MPVGHPEAFTETDVASGGGSKGGGLRGHCPEGVKNAREAHRLATTERMRQRAPIPPSGGGGATYLFTYGGFVNNNYHARAPRRRAHEERSDEKP